MNIARLDLLTEKEWARQVAELARMLSWRRYHTFRSTRSTPGFPDETLVRDRVIFLELKTETGKLSDAQKDWLSALLKASAEAYVARPSDLEDLAEVLQSRGRVDNGLAARTRSELQLANAPPDPDATPVGVTA